MDLRTEFQLPLLDPQAVCELAALTEKICDLLEAAQPADDLIERFNQQAAHTYAPSDFIGIQGYTDFSSFASVALTPDAPHIGQVSIDELTEVAGRLMAATADHELAFYLSVFKRNTPHPSPQALWEETSSAQEFAVRAFGYRPIILDHDSSA